MVWLHRTRDFSLFLSAFHSEMETAPCKICIEIIVWNVAWWHSYCFSISACNRTCKTCSSSTACLTCRNGLILNRNGHCMLSGHCSRTEYYDDKTETCKTCHKKCFHCSGPTEHQCISCANNRYLFSKCLPPVYSILTAWNKPAYVTFIKHLGLL